MKPLTGKIVMLVAVLSQRFSIHAAELRFGAATVDITPDRPVALVEHTVATIKEPWPTSK